MSEAQKDFDWRGQLIRLADDGVRSVEIVATLDNRSCGQCIRDDEKIYPIKQALREMPLPHRGEKACRCAWVAADFSEPRSGLSDFDYAHRRENEHPRQGFYTLTALTFLWSGSVFWLISMFFFWLWWDMGFGISALISLVIAVGIINLLWKV